MVATVGLISLGGGLPSPEYFPFEEVSVKVPTPPGFSPQETQESGTVLTAKKGDVQAGRSLYGTYGDFENRTPSLIFRRPRGCSQLWTIERFPSAPQIRDGAYRGMSFFKPKYLRRLT
jgi:hypothetical protein